MMPTITVSESVYDRLEARKRPDERFTDVIDRLLDETTANWRATFGSMTPDDANELNEIVSQSRVRTSRELTDRQRRSLESFSDE